CFSSRVTHYRLPAPTPRDRCRIERAPAPWCRTMGAREKRRAERSSRRLVLAGGRVVRSAGEEFIGLVLHLVGVLGVLAAGLLVEHVAGLVDAGLHLVRVLARE